MYNRDLLMCRPDFFRIVYKINPWMRLSTQPDPATLKREYDTLVTAHLAAGRTVRFIEPVREFPDQTFTANHALIRDKRAVLANLPTERAGEVAHTRTWLEANGYETVECPYRFGGQGDALPTGTGAVIKGRPWRSDPRSDAFVRDHLGYEIIPIRTVSDRWYDNDLVIAVLRPGLLAIAMNALDDASQATLRGRTDLEIIPVSLVEAAHFVLNLVSDGTTITMPAGVPRLEHEFERRGFTVVPLPITQLALSGGGVRCTTLALDAR